MGSLRLKYLAMIQTVITRMAANQFTARKWSVALGTAIIGWAISKEADPTRALVAILPAACFWIMDAYYLSLERRFRNLFDEQRQINNNAPDFSLKPPSCWWQWPLALVRPAVWLVHGPVVLLAWGVGRWGWLR
jgi:hypothetical protein